MKIIINSDGGARGNPGPAGIGFIIKNLSTKNKVCEGKFIGTATNNQAEYKAIISALSWVKENVKEAGLEIECRLDSELIVEQINGRYKIKNEGLKPLFWQMRDLIVALGGNVVFKYVPRSENKEADSLVNKAIDRKEGQ